MTKRGVRDHLNYKNAANQPTVDDQRGVIPEEALSAVLGTQHIEMKKWREDMVKRVRKSTFSNAERFVQPKLNYRIEAADLSLLDCDRSKLENVPTKHTAHGWQDVPGR